MGKVKGDFDATFTGLLDNHIIDETLILDVSGGVINEAIVTSYQGRGFDSDPKNYNTFKVGDGEGTGGRIMLTFCLGTQTECLCNSITTIFTLKGRL